MLAPDVGLGARMKGMNAYALLRAITHFMLNSAQAFLDQCQLTSEELCLPVHPP